MRLRPSGLSRNGLDGDPTDLGIEVRVDDEGRSVHDSNVT